MYNNLYYYLCYIQTDFLLQVIENEFSTFVNTSEDYDVDKALRYLLKNHLVFFALQVHFTHRVP